MRLHVELDSLQENGRTGNRNITADDLIVAAQRILTPYSLDVRDVVWWSVCETGQRLTDKFDDSPADNRAPRVFIAGDACHIHSPKAGQGMRVSMGDAFNLGWKLVSGAARPVSSRPAAQLFRWAAVGGQGPDRLRPGVGARDRRKIGRRQRCTKVPAILH